MAKINNVMQKPPSGLHHVNEDLLFKRVPPMKVTVKFEATSVVVPVAEGMLVSDLIEAAVHRYKKVGNKPVDAWVDVKRLLSSSGGILCPDDSLIRVVDDKEQIVAIFDEQDASSAQHSYIFPHNVDYGSVGTTSNSPDFVRSSSTNSSAGSNATSSGGGRCNYATNKFSGAGTPPVSSTPPPVPPRFLHPPQNFQKVVITPNSSTDERRLGERFTKKHRVNINQTQDSSNSVVVKRLDDIPASSSLLIVRRGSEPALNGPDDVAAAECADGNEESGGQQKLQNKVKWPTHPDLAAEGRSSTDTEDDNIRSGAYVNESNTGMGKFVRSGARKSRVTEEMLEVAAQLAEDHRHAAHDDDDDEVDVSFSAGQEKHKRFEIHYISVKCDDDKKSLGLQVLPEYGEIGHLSSLIVKYIQPGLRAAVDGQLKVNDRIVEINDSLVSEMSFVGAQTFLHNASNQGRLSVKVMRPPAAESSCSSSMDVGSKSTTTKKENGDHGGGTMSQTTIVAPLSNLQKANTRKIGRKLTVDIVKNPEGLGFTLTSRDNAAAGDNFTCIKNILPRGSAIKDGRLKEGDKILEINDVNVTGMAKEKIVSLLRDVKEGQTVKLVVSRQENVESSSLSPVLPRQLPADRANVETLDSERYSKQRLVFDIPLNDTGSAGLGVSVKGRTATELGTKCENQQQQQRDCGIFIKTIMHGGAAHKDGRLKVNDQLIAVNDMDLTNLSNKDAMNRLRTTMQDLDPSASSIKLIVRRTMAAMAFGESSFSPGTVRFSTPPMSPGTPDGAASLLLEMPGPCSPAGSIANHRTVHYLVPGYGDYAVIVKDPLTHAPTLSLGSRTEEAVVIEDDEFHRTVHRQTSSDTKSETFSSGVEEADYYQSVNDPFVRDAPTRQSMSEKRHGAAKLDPSSTLTFQRIKHHRQSSAPSLQDPQNETNARISYKTDLSSFQGNSLSVSVVPATALTNERRSLSLESLGPSTLAVVQQQQQQQIQHYYPTFADNRPLIHEQIAQNVLRNSNLHGPPSKVKSKSKLSAAQRARMTNDSFRAAVDKSYDENGLEVAVDVDGAGDTPLDSPMDTQGSSSSPRSNFVNKDKSRRKSTGSGLSTLKSLFRFGSGGKSNKRLGSTYEEKIVDHQQQLQKQEAELQARRRAEEEQRKIRMHYERLKEQEQQKQHLSHRHRSPNKHRYPPSSSSQMQPNYFNVAHSKMPSHWKPPPVPPSSLSSSSYASAALSSHPPSHSMQLRYHSPSDPTQLSSGNGFYRVVNGQNYSAKNYDTDDGYGELNVAIVETNRCYRSLERPSAHSVAITGVPRSIGVQSRDKPSPKETGTNNVQQQNRRGVVHHSHQQQQRLYGRSADGDWPNFEGDSTCNNNNNNYQQPNCNSKRSREHHLDGSTVTTVYVDQMPPIPPPDYDQYLRTTSKAKAPRKIRPASDYVGNGNSHKSTSLPRRPIELQHQQQQQLHYHNQQTKDSSTKQQTESLTPYDSYGSLPRNGHFTTVRM